MKTIKLFIVFFIHTPCWAQDVIWTEEFTSRQSSGALPDALATLPETINRINQEQLHATGILSTEQIEALLDYRRKYGTIISKYELMAIESITPADIRRLEEFVIFEELPFDLPVSVVNEVTEGSITSLIRTKLTGDKREVSSRLRFMLSKPGKFEFGLRTDHDAGERWRFRPPGQWGFDHLSVYLIIPVKGMIKKVIFGDIRVHIGQGLVQNGAFRMGKGSSLPLPPLSSYAVASGTYSESGRMTGVAATLADGYWNAATYISHRREDAAINEEGSFTSFTTDGLHRTEAEIRKRDVVSISSFGAFAERRVNNGLAGAAFHSDLISIPMKHKALYKAVMPQGKLFNQLSIYGNYQYRGLLTWFEISVQQMDQIAGITGISAALDRHIEAVLLYRSYSPGFASIFGSAFGEQSANRNEEGLYMGLRYIRGKRWHIFGYFDIYRFPWYSYRRGKSLSGSDFRLDGEWKAGTYRIRAFIKSEVHIHSGK